MAFVLPSKREAGVLMNPDLAKEWDQGNKAVYSDGTETTLTYNAKILAHKPCRTFCLILFGCRIADTLFAR